MVNSNIEWEWIIVGCYLYTSVEREDRQMDRKSIKLYLLCPGSWDLTGSPL